MNAFISFLFIAIGVAIGVCGMQIYLKITLQKLLAQVKDERTQLENQRAEENRLANEQIEGLREKLKEVREEVKKYWAQLQEETRTRSAVEDRCARIPVLEEALGGKEALVKQLQGEQAELKVKIASLEAKIKEQRESFKEGLVFVHGNHYLPGSVIRTLTKRSKAADDAGQ